MLKHFLDQPKQYSKKDPSGVHQSLTLLDKQFSSSVETVKEIKLKHKYSSINRICIAGMGGSALSGRIIKSLSPYLFSIPIDISSNYRLPAFVDKNTLVIVVSYSGNTEETISSLKDAVSRQSHIFVISSGGELIRLAKNFDIDYYQIKPEFNPSGAPRTGVFYSLGAILQLLVSLGIIYDQVIDFPQLTSTITQAISGLKNTVLLKDNPAKKLALQHKGRSVLLVSANHLDGVAYAAKNLINESAKTFSTNFDLPELNHHLLEGLGYPSSMRNWSSFVFLNSNNYPKLINRIVVITKEIIDRQKYSTTVLKADATEPISEAFETLTFFSFFSYYLGIINQIDPGSIPWVNYFKKRIKDV